MMSSRFAVPVLLLTIPATAALAEGYSCEADRVCIGTQPCLTLETPKRLTLDAAHSGFDVSLGGALSESPFRVIDETLASDAVFLIAEQEFTPHAERWLLTILPDGTLRMTVHRTQSFGEFETLLGTCEVTE